MLALNPKDKKYPIKIEQQCLKFLLVFTSYNEGQIHLLKVKNMIFGVELKNNIFLVFSLILCEYLIFIFS